MPEFYTWTILLINQLDEIGENQRGPNLPLNTRSSWEGLICITIVSMSRNKIAPESQANRFAALQGPELQCLLKVKEDLS